MIGSLAARARLLAKERVGPVVARRAPRRVDLPLDRWGLRIGEAGTLRRDDVDLADLAAREGTPLHVVDADRLAANAARALVARDATPPVDVFYSYKTNPVPDVLARLHGLGIGAEVISPFELWLALRLGVPGERIIYNGPAKSPESLRVAIRERVHLVNANSLGEAALVARLAGEERIPVRLGLRVALPGMWGGQFGLDATTPHVADAVRTAVGAPFVELVGLHLHRGLTIRDEAMMTGYVGAALVHTDELAAATGWRPEVLDLGGSLPCPTVAAIPHREMRLNRALGTDLLPPDPNDALTLDRAAMLVSDLVGVHAAAGGHPPPRVVLEPGRALTGDAQLLLASVVDVKRDTALAHAVLDAGVNVAEPVRSEYHQLFSATAPGAPAAEGYRLVGPICTPADVLYNHWRLPQLEPGHVLAIMDSGAYFVPFATAFSFPRPPVVVIETGDLGSTVTTVRRRETFADLVALDVDGPGDLAGDQ